MTEMAKAASPAAGGRVTSDRRNAVVYSLCAFGVYLAGELTRWAVRGSPGGRSISAHIFLPLYTLAFFALPLAVALRVRRHPILTAAAASGAVVFTALAVQVPLTPLLPGLVLKDHDRWAAGAITDAVQFGCVAAAVAAVLAGGTRLVAWLWSARARRSR